ncbi:MAG: RNA-guided endonuclease IscB [Chloroflexi bacterium]|nr:RNA-guided endonuclease IscB [Chloroflexota bacterium]
MQTGTTVFVLSSDGQPLDSCHPARARLLLDAGRAAVYRRYPFTIILKHRASVDSTVHPHRLKIDPGSKTTGLAIVQEPTGKVVWAGEITHRGHQIRNALLSRKQVRRGRRDRKLRYRAPRFNNRRRPEGWLPPSLLSRVANIETWVRRLRRFCPVKSISLELVKFDTQAIQNPEIAGVEYQQGELFGYEIREYLLEKWDRKCAYCGAENAPLEIEHIIPRARGGTSRVSNLALACRPCNQAKGARTAAEFGHPEVQEKARRPLKDAAAVNATRWELYRRLSATGLPVECGTGGRTKYNRTRLGLPKTHWLDAACVGASTPHCLTTRGVSPLLIRSQGHGSRQMCRMDRFGFPRTSAKQSRFVHGFQTGDLVTAVVPSGRKAGAHAGRVAVRTSGYFNIQTPMGVIQGISWRWCNLLHRSDGYAYSLT